MAKLRKWATPLTIGAFLLMTVTGTLMFFHLDSGANKLVHEWAGWLMLAGVLAHLAVNYRAFLRHLTQPLGRGIVAALSVVLALSFIPVPGASGSPVAAVMQGLGNAQVAQVMALSGEPFETVAARLSDAGFAPDPGMTVAELAGGDRSRQGAILWAIFGG